MKKTIFALMCLAGLAMMTACGGDKDSKTVTGDEKIDAKLEQAEKKLSEMTSVEKCEATWKKMYGLELADVQPDFDFEEVIKGFDSFMGNGVNLAKAVYKKKDGSMITPEEWKAYMKKVFDVTKKLAQDGKNVKGFNTGEAKTREDALVEVTLEQMYESSNPCWCFLKDDRFQACYPSLVEMKGSNYIVLSLSEGIQKNMDEALEDAEKYLKK